MMFASFQSREAFEDPVCGYSEAQSSFKVEYFTKAEHMASCGAARRESDPCKH